MAVSPDLLRLLVRLLTGYEAQRTQLTERMVATAAASAQGFSRWYDTAAITDWATKLAATQETYQRALARLTDAYLARSLSAMTDRSIRPVGNIDVTALRQGVTHAGVYGRAADEFRYQRSRLQAGADVVSAQQAAVQRAKDAADMDALLAVRAQAQTVLEQQSVVTGYRRILHPELSKGGSCGLCVAASHRLYKKSDLLPVHARCHCVPLPVLDGRDPGSVINDQDLAKLYKDAGSTGAGDLSRTRYRITDHGELGPLLVAATDHVRTASDAQRDERS